MDPHWYAVWTRSRHEKLVRDQLAKKSDVDVFLPTIGKWSRWKDRKKKIDWPLFPGDRKSTRLNSSHVSESRMPSSA